MVSKITFAWLQFTTSNYISLCLSFSEWKILALGFAKILKKYCTFPPNMLHWCCTEPDFYSGFISSAACSSLLSPPFFFFFSLPLLSLVFHFFFPFDSAPLLLPNLLLPCVPVFPPSLCVCPLTSPVFLPETSLPIDSQSLTTALLTLMSFSLLLLLLCVSSPFFKVAKICF